MSRVDPDLVAVRDLPPGVEEPSDEAVARVWRRITERPAARARRWPAPRLWVPIAAAAAVLLVVGAGIVALRPHPKAVPTGPLFSSDPARIAQVFTDLTAVARTATPIRLRAGQLIYYRADEIRPIPQDGRLRVALSEEWITPGLETLFYAHDRNPGPGDVLAVRRSAESAKHPRPAGVDNRPWARVGDQAIGSGDPAAIRRQALERTKNQTTISDNRKIWDEVAQRTKFDPVLPVGHRLALYRVLAGLPVTVGETTVAGRRLVVVRFVEGDEASDLFFDPATGRVAGRQLAHVGPGRWWQDDPMYSPAAEPKSRPAGGPSSAAAEWRIVPADAVDPGVFARQMAGFAVVEEVGERP